MGYKVAKKINKRPAHRVKGLRKVFKYTPTHSADWREAYEALYGDRDKKKDDAT